MRSWVIRKNGKNFEILDESTNFTVATVYEDDSGAGEEDAELIASAPKLRDALNQASALLAMSKIFIPERKQLRYEQDLERIRSSIRSAENS